LLLKLTREEGDEDGGGGGGGGGAPTCLEADDVFRTVFLTGISSALFAFLS
jgi:hypothetical protein